MGDTTPEQFRYTVPEELERLDRSGFAPSTNALITGQEGSRARELAIQALVSGEPDEGKILVTTQIQPAEIVDMYRELSSDGNLSNLHVIDATGLQGDHNGSEDTDHVVSTVTTITDIGISITESERLLDADRLRLGFLSVHPVLDVVEPDQAFSFLYLLTTRVEQSGYMGVFTVRTDTIAPKTIHTFEHLFDGVAEMRPSNPDEPTVQLRGFGE